MLIHNAVIYTQNPDMPIAEAMLIQGSRIVKVGSYESIKNKADDSIKEIDLEGRVVLPGFSDTHIHFYQWAVNYDSIDLSTAISFNDMGKALKSKARSAEKGKWITGLGFNEHDWPMGNIPDRYDLDKIVPDNPVCIWRYDLHMCVANSRALALAGIDSHSSDPLGGIIARDSSGSPTGILRELAINLITRVLEKPGKEEILCNMEKRIKELHGFGITSIHDIRLMGGVDGAEALDHFQELNNRKKLNIRCHVSLAGEMTDQAVGLGLKTGFGNDRLKIGHLKFFADGGMGARTAWMIDKYLDADYGMPAVPLKTIESAVIKAQLSGLSVMVHAIGDRAVREIISMFKRIEKNNLQKLLIPHRIEHVQMIRDEDLIQLKTLQNVALSCQPNNLTLDIPMIEMSVGENKRYAFRLRSILNTGLPFILNSDAPVCTPNPFIGIYAAVTRCKLDNKPLDGWFKSQALTVEEAVAACTITPCVTQGTGEILGSIAPGKFADVVVLNGNIYSMAPEKIKDIKIDMTIFNGEIVYER